AVCGPRKAMPSRLKPGVTDCGVQDAPPSVVHRTTPLYPTAAPVWASAKEIPYRSEVASFSLTVQVSPPSMLRTIVAGPPILPDAPTATTVFGSAKATAPRIFLVPLCGRVQLLPPSVVRTMAPRTPTAMKVCASAAATPTSLFPCGSGFSQDQP